jgi:purine catabolism regulator
VAEALEFLELTGSVVVAGRDGLDRPVRQVNVMQIPTDRFAKPDELILAASSAFADLGAGRPALVEALADRRVAALAIRGGRLREVLGPEALHAADACRLPLIELPREAHLGELQTRVLEMIVTTQATQLRRDSAVRDRIAGHVLSGGDLTTLPQAVAGILGGDVAVFDSRGQALAASTGTDRERTSEVARAWSLERIGAAEVDGWVVWPVTAGERPLGCIVARMPERWEPAHVVTLEHGAAIAALEILNQQEAAEAEVRFHAGFVRDLLSGSLDPESARRRAAAIGWSPDAEFRVVLATEDPGELTRVVESVRVLAPGTLVTQRDGACLAVLPCKGDGDPGEQPEAPVELSQGLAARFPGLHVGVSARHVGLGPLPLAISEAQEALQAARMFTARTRVHLFDELGVLSLLLDVPDEELRAFQESVLGGLTSLPPASQRPLQETLELLIQCNLNVAETARRGGWHYNTVRYRVARLGELLGPFTDAGMVLDAVQLALLLRRELAER